MKFKTVKDLKEALNKVDENLPVATYVEEGEDMDVFHEVRVEERGSEDCSYCRGDHVCEIYDLPKVVVIG